MLGSRHTDGEAQARPNAQLDEMLVLEAKLIVDVLDVVCVLITQSCDTRQVNSGYSNFLYFIRLRINGRTRRRYLYL